MHKILMVLRREYLESVKKKAFWIGTAVFPIFIVGIFGLQIVAQLASPERVKPLAVLDESGLVAGRLDANLAEDRLSNGDREFPVELIATGPGLKERRAAAVSRVEAGELYGLVSIGPDLGGEDNFRLDWKNIGDRDTRNRLRSALQDAVVDARLATSDLGIEKAKLDELTAWISLETFQVTRGGESKQKGLEEAILPTFMFVMMLYFLIYFHGYSMTRGIVQEKSSRVMEVLLGSISPDQLMAGKILGIGLVGLTQVSVYIVTGLAVRAAARFWLTLGDLQSVMDVFSADKLAAFGLFYLLGYFLFVSVFAMVGAACNTDQEAQQLQLPVVTCLMLPMMTTFFFIQNPDTTLATVLSLVPIFTPMVMFMRVSVLTPPVWQIALSVVLMLGTIYVFFRAAAKIFRVGTLMYGKRPSLREIVRWARA